MTKAEQKILPHLWFDHDQAWEAAEFYTQVFPESRIEGKTVIKGTPSGDCDFVIFDLWGMRFMGISAGPAFKFTPAISFIVNYDPSRLTDARSRLDKAWGMLAEGGKALMPLDKYPFSERYGWIQDKYGLSWQLMLTNPSGEPRPEIIPSLMFIGKNAGKAEAAIEFYKSAFQRSKTGMMARYGASQAPDREGTLMFADFQLHEQWFAAMDSAREHKFDFNEAVSLLVACETQKEIDAYSDLLSADPKAEQCGWLKDKFGVSWQIQPKLMNEILMQGTEQQKVRVIEAFLKMKRFDIAKVKAAYSGG